MGEEPIEVRAATPAEAEDEDLIRRWVALVDDAYAVAEAGMWRPGARRTTEPAMRAFVREGRIRLALLGSAVVGVVDVHPVDGDVVGFGMLAADLRVRGRGIGRRLVAAAEDVARASGAGTVQLELLVPLRQDLASKVALAAWYTRLGYRRVASGSIADDHPELVEDLQVEAEYQIWQKPLRHG